MTVDLRASVSTNLGTCISGDIGTNHISDRSGLVMTQGRLVFKGIVSPARGSLISFAVALPQKGEVTRFPKPLRVIRSSVNTRRRRSEIQVGCKLTLMKNKKDAITYYPSDFAPGWFSNLDESEKKKVVVPIYSQKLLEFCLDRIGIKMSATTTPLQFVFLRPGIDLSEGYIKVIGDLLRSECCFGRLRPDETFEVVPLNLAKGSRGPVLDDGNLVSIEPITVGQEPADSYIVTYTAAERTA